MIKRHHRNTKKVCKQCNLPYSSNTRWILERRKNRCTWNCCRTCCIASSTAVCAQVRRPIILKKNRIENINPLLTKIKVKVKK